MEAFSFSDEVNFDFSIYSLKLSIEQALTVGDGVLDVSSWGAKNVVSLLVAELKYYQPAFVKSLRSLVLDNNQVSEEDFKCLYQYLQDRPHIRHISLRRCGLNTDGFAILIGMLILNNSYLTSLDISGNHLHEFAHRITGALAWNNSLLQLKHSLPFVHAHKISLELQQSQQGHPKNHGPLLLLLLFARTDPHSPFFALPLDNFRDICQWARLGKLPKKPNTTTPHLFASFELQHKRPLVPSLHLDLMSEAKKVASASGSSSASSSGASSPSSSSPRSEKKAVFRIRSATNLLKALKML